ncbi:Tetrathionate response regulatory protein TtrR [Posidoniimonas polymericola]|uniref:Tetrathionate response regulatory protein TtrR n=1 Tax=Posidoniimonas polymericola TaxID=2528002 RepID=A0A5C5ZEI6_9BACT|nr:helix-turn-helix transcriptional regulator [Posidoniimonas polymericola]TWT85774.1 Tetrathionate response regulatory protein TtrR [Posidoniimonas polymericola]
MVELTDREHQLLRLLVEGASNRVAANEMGIALRTMELHRQKVMQKLGAKSAAQLGYLYCMVEKGEPCAAS